MTIRLLSVLSFIFLLLACDDEHSEIKKLGKVKLSIGMANNARTGRANSTNLDKIKKIVVSIETSDGTLVHDLHALELVRFNDSFVSEELELKTGTYNVTKFFATDEDQNVLYATPLENSPLASLVADPLPVTFVVNADGIAMVFMEAVSVEETLPKDFGYVTFALGLIDYKSFEVSATIADENYTGPVNGIFEVFAKNTQGQIVWSKSWDISQKIDITIPVAERYSFKLSKAGHLPHAQHYNFDMIKQASKLSFELIPESSDDFIVKDFPGKATLYFPVDKGKLYARVDLEEEYALTNVDFVDVDRYVTNITADHPSAYVYATVTYINYVPEGEDGRNMFVNRAINLFDNNPFTDAYDLRNVPFTLTQSHFFEDFDRDATVDSQIFLYKLKDDYNFNYDVHYQVWPLKQDFLDYWCDTNPNACDELTEKFNAYNSQVKTTPELNGRRKNLLNQNAGR